MTTDAHGTETVARDARRPDVLGHRCRWRGDRRWTRPRGQVPPLIETSDSAHGGAVLLSY